jgi:uncharacterized membrane protein
MPEGLLYLVFLLLLLLLLLVLFLILLFIFLLLRAARLSTRQSKIDRPLAAIAQDLGSCPARGEGSNPSSRSVETNEPPAEFCLTGDGPALR